MVTRRDRIAGGVWGLLVGDALGVPYEFSSPAEVAAVPDIDMAPPAGFDRAHATVPIGTWSDDGAQALCLLSSLLDTGGLDVDHFAARLLAWYEKGFMAVDGRVFDVGNQTTTALRALQRGTAPRDAGPSEERHNGNGSLMRVLPLALFHQGSDADLVRDAYSQSTVTHGHARARVCCALYCLWARRLLDGQATEEAWADAVSALRREIVRGTPEADALEGHIRPDERIEGTGTGYVVDTLHSVRWVLAAPSYEATVKRAIALGHDTDTTACVAGGLAGVRDGVDGIPARWRQSLRGKNLFEPLLARLLARG